MAHGNSLETRAKAFIRQLFHVYLETREFGQLWDMLHPQVTWVGTGSHEICRSFPHTASFLEAEYLAWSGCYQILEYSSQATALSENFCMVFGEIKLREDKKNTIVIGVHTRFSMICTQEQGKLLLYHAHFSLPNSAQEDGEFQHTVLVESYQALLESKLHERTAQLKEKTEELEHLANNISGGVQVCAIDQGFTIRYVSDGFVKLLGRSRDELLETPHAQLIHPADVALMRAQILRQSESTGEFSVVYRIIRADGEIRWVLDNGNVFRGADGAEQLQCFLADITAQKRQEEELFISQKRYEVALKQLDVSMFEYNIVTRQLALFETEASLYGMSTVIEDGPNVLAQSGYFDPACVPGYLEMYRKICSGEEISASCLMSAHDVDGKRHDFELSLTAVLDETGAPIRAIGVKKNTSHLQRLQREQAFAKTMAGGRNFICEADISRDRFLRIDPLWRNRLGATETSSYVQTMQRAIKRYVSEAQQTHMLRQLSAENLISLLEKGSHIEHFAFEMTDADSGERSWHETTVNVIRDETAGTAYVRIYHKNISERKRKEAQAAEERRLYESMIAKSMIAFEVNVSQDLLFPGQEHWDAQYEMVGNSNYSQMIAAAAQNGMHPQDSPRFLNSFERRRVLDAYYHGESEIVCQYRKRNQIKGFLWVECTMHLFECPDNSDVCAYAYVENIDKQKQAELQLLYKAEHDAHTDLYNKETTVERISRYLQTPEGKYGLHAFFMVDLDHFKDINDNFGHLFGDRVIADQGARIRALFREDDIVGRVGGDEFCVFMKHAANVESVAERAQQLCQILTQSYVQGDCIHVASASAGIALFPQHGRNFTELYRCADSALYDAKRGGRSRYAIAD